MTKVPETIETPPILPELKDLNGKISKKIMVEKPRIVRSDETVKVGATERKIDAPLDREPLGNKTHFRKSPSPFQRTTDESETRNDSGVKGGMTGSAE